MAKDTASGKIPANGLSSKEDVASETTKSLALDSHGPSRGSVDFRQYCVLQEMMRLGCMFLSERLPPPYEFHTVPSSQLGERVLSRDSPRSSFPLKEFYKCEVQE